MFRQGVMQLNVDEYKTSIHYDVFNEVIFPETHCKELRYMGEASLINTNSLAKA